MSTMQKGHDGLHRVVDVPPIIGVPRGAHEAVVSELERVTRDRDALRRGLAPRDPSNTVNSPASLIRRTSMRLNEGIGVGFWNKVDAIAQAEAEEARTGRSFAVVVEPTPRGTHGIWWVREVTEDATWHGKNARMAGKTEAVPIGVGAPCDRDLTTAKGWLE